jgi:glutamate-1-semialdehyde 2,1-aminomutase
MRRSLQGIIDRLSLEATVVGFGSVFVVYWGKGPFERYEDVVALDAKKDLWFRRSMIDRGTYLVPVCLKRCLFSYSHTERDRDEALNIAEDVLRSAAR